MKKSFIVLIHLGFWACYFLLVFIVLAVYSRSGTHVSDQEGRVMTAFYSILLFAFIPSVISYFLYYFILFPRYLQQKKIVQAILMGLLISIAVSYTHLRIYCFAPTHSTVRSHPYTKLPCYMSVPSIIIWLARRC